MTLLLLASGPLSMPGVRVEKAARAWAEAVETQAFVAKITNNAIAAKIRPHTTSGLTAADVGKLASHSSSGKVRAGARPSGGWLAMMSQALGDAQQADDNDEIDAADLPDDFDSDGCQPGWALVTFAALHLLGPAGTLVEPNLWGIQPAIGHPLGVDEPPRV